MQALRARDGADELSVRREDIHRRAGCDIHASLLVDGGPVASLAALELAELALVGQ